MILKNEILRFSVTFFCIFLTCWKCLSSPYKKLQLCKKIALNSLKLRARMSLWVSESGFYNNERKSEQSLSANFLSQNFGRGRRRWEIDLANICCVWHVNLSVSLQKCQSVGCVAKCAFAFVHSCCQKVQNLQTHRENIYAWLLVTRVRIVEEKSE